MVNSPRAADGLLNLRRLAAGERRAGKVQDPERSRDLDQEAGAPERKALEADCFEERIRQDDPGDGSCLHQDSGVLSDSANGTQA